MSCCVNVTGRSAPRAKLQTDFARARPMCCFRFGASIPFAQYTPFWIPLPMVDETSFKFSGKVLLKCATTNRLPSQPSRC